MKTILPFFKKMIIFLIPLLILTLSIDFYLRNMNTSYKEKEKMLDLKKDSIEILVLGNSHAYYGVDPKQFELETYNLANVNQSIYFDKRLTLKFIDALPKLKFVLISVDYHSLYFSSQGIRDIWSYYSNGIKYKSKNYILSDISPFLFGYTPKASVTLLKNELINKWKYKNQKIIDFNVESGVNIKNSMYNGFLPFENHNSTAFTNQKYKKRASNFLKTIQESEEKSEIILDLADFIKILKGRGVLPVLFSTPCYKEYIQLLNNEIIQKNNTDIRILCNNFNIEFFDYASSELFQKSDFRNCDHLNKIGAAKFSKILNKRIEKLK